MTVQMPQDAEERRLKLVMEYNKLLAWGKVAGLIEIQEGQKISVSLGADPWELVNVLQRIKMLLSQFAELNGEYIELNPHESPEKEEEAKAAAAKYDIQKEVSTLALKYEEVKKTRKHIYGTNHLVKSYKGLREITKHPKRIIWTLFDKDAFDTLLKDLHYLTDRLQELMGDYHARKINETTTKTFMEMVQVRAGVEEIQSFQKLLVLSVSASANSGAPQIERDGTLFLSELLRLKCLTIPIEKLEDDQLKPNSWTHDELKLLSPEALGQARGEGEEVDEASKVRTRAELKKDGKTTQVWIEWKPYERVDIDDKMQIPQNTIKRTAALAQMLRLQKPSQFCTPTCLGFFDDHTLFRSRRFGWVFDMGDSPVKTVPRSLLSMIRESPVTPCPSLTARVALASKLASCVLYLHIVNWLHKAVRSENVIFLFSDDQFDIEKPVLSGFEYSRPDSSGQTSERSDQPRSDWEMYRYPTLQYQTPSDKNSIKTYDIYALGLVLLEIAHWKSLDILLQLKDPRKLSQAGCQAIRERLLNDKSGPLEQLRHLVGLRYYQVVYRCILAHGDDAFGVGEDENQSSGEIGLKLQQTFMTKAIQELNKITV
jgi:hypothetical protein